MNRLSVNFILNSNLCLKDPVQSELGRKILRHSVLLIDEIGLEQFNFKKLAKAINTTEPTVYRYFLNKNQLFLYLLNWYWEWVMFRIDLHNMNVANPMQKLKNALRVIVDSSKRNMETPFIDEDILHKIVVREGIKAYHSINVDEENKEGYFLSYKMLCKKLADILLEINHDMPYPRSLASTLLETANNNIYFAKHLPRLTDIKADESNVSDEVVKLLEYLVSNMVKPVVPDTAGVKISRMAVLNGA